MEEEEEEDEADAGIEVAEVNVQKGFILIFGVSLFFRVLDTGVSIFQGINAYFWNPFSQGDDTFGGVYIAGARYPS